MRKLLVCLVLATGACSAGTIVSGADQGPGKGGPDAGSGAPDAGSGGLDAGGIVVRPGTLDPPQPPPPGTPGWYVDAVNGDDGHDGRTVATAFRTIERAVGDASALRAGDTVYIKAGLYRERPRVFASGTQAARITIRAYGDGEVIVDGSPAVSGWTSSGGQVYRATPGFRPMGVVADGKALFPGTGAATLGQGEYFYDGSALHVWLPGGGSPAEHDVGVIDDEPFASSSPDADAIQLYRASDVTISFLTVRFASGSGISVGGSDRVRVEGCRTLFNGKSGITFWRDGGAVGRDDVAHANEVYMNVMSNWPRGAWESFCGGGWPAALSGQGVARVTLSANFSHDNGGEGILSYNGEGGALMEDNISADNWSANYYLDNEPDGVIRNNLSIAHEPDLMKLVPVSRNRVECQKRLRPNGILTADENYGGGSSLRNVLIANNVIIGARTGYGHNSEVSGSGLKQVRFVNNTIVLPDSAGFDGITGIAIARNDGNNQDSLFANNLVYGRHPESVLLNVLTENSSDPLAGVTLSNNLWYHAARARPITYSDSAPDWTVTSYTPDEWHALPGGTRGAGDVAADPLLPDPSSYEAAAMKPQAGSPAIEAGMDSGLTVDFTYGARPVGAYDIGAFEQ